MWTWFVPDSSGRSRLALMAPREFLDALKPALEGADVRVDWHPLPPPNPVRRQDAFEVRARVEAGGCNEADAVLLVVPRRRSPRAASPPAVVGRTVVGMVQADHPDDLRPWLMAIDAPDPGRSPQPEIAVCAMGKRVFRERGADWIRALSTTGLATEDWGAHLINRVELCQRLAKGAEVVVYLGHGRARGWSGYQALRWHHVTANKARIPIRVMFAFACNTLTRTRGVVPFGTLYVHSGRVVAYLGWAGSVQIEPGLRFADRLFRLLASGRTQTLSGLLRRAVGEVKDIQEKRELERLRLIGYPFARLPCTR